MTLPALNPSDPFEGPKLKIARAKRHIADYRVAFKAFAEANATAGVPHSNVETRMFGVHFPASSPFTGEMKMTAADALYNLRSALDQAVCRCAILARKSAKNTYFPHGKTSACFNESIRNKCKKVPHPVRDVITSLQPYLGGHGYLLESLHNLNVIDKHTELLKFVPTLKRIEETTTYQPPANSEERENVEFLFSEQNVHHHVEVVLLVTFSDVEGIEGKSATQVLLQMCDLVEKTVALIEKSMLGYLTNHGGMEAKIQSYPE